MIQQHINYYKNYNVLHKMLPYLKNKEFVLGYPKHHEKGQSLKARHRCHNFQSLSWLLFKKYEIQTNEYNIFSSVATYNEGIPYTIDGELQGAKDWFCNHYKSMTEYDLFLDIDTETHEEIHYAWKSTKLIIDFFNSCNCPYSVRFSGRGFHIIVPFKAFNLTPNPELFDKDSPKRIFRLYAKIRKHLIDNFTELIDTKATGNTAKIKVPYSVAMYENKQYICTPLTSEHEFNTFLLEKYKPPEIADTIRLRNEKLFNFGGSSDNMLNKIGVSWLKV